MNTVENIEYQSIICVDLRSFDRELPDLGVECYFEHIGFVPDAVCFLNFQLMYLFDFERVDDRALDPICTGQNGTPCDQVWTNRDLYRLVEQIRARKVKAYLGLLSNTISPVWKNTNYRWQYEEVLQTARGGRLMWGEAVNVLKHLKDGRLFEDVFADKLMAVLDAFGFDGYVAGDGMLGLRGPRETLKDTDFSKDMVEQFAAYAEIEPVEIEDYDERADYIVANWMPEWIGFWRFRWGEHVARISRGLKERGKSFLAIDAWSRNPEEILVSFGIDYRLLYEKGLEAVFVQARETNKWRKHREGEYVREQNSIYTFLAHKAYEPRLKYYWAQATVNVPEFWNTVQDLPQVAERETYGYLWTHYFDGESWERICDGLCIIWGNDLSRENWNWLKLRWDQAFGLCRNYREPVGLTLLWTERGVDSKRLEAVEYGRRIAALIENGVCIQSVTGEEGFLKLVEEKQFEGYFVTTDETLGERYPQYLERMVFVREDGIWRNQENYDYEQGIPMLKKLAGIQMTKGRIMGFEAENGEYILSLENPDNLFYQQGYLAVDREITRVRALQPREWFVLPNSLEGGSVAVSVPPDASLQLIVQTDRKKKTKLQFREKNLGI